MLAGFSIIPIGVGSSIGDQLAVALKIVDESGLPYKAGPMNTVIEGEWEEIIPLIKKCRDAIMEKEDRVVISITIDDRKGKLNMIEEKLSSVEKRLGKSLKK
ncbi:MAG: MTH1187 family thiamine-binding protein [Nitrospiraceae bacterium]|nr:MAG: MTH1187 family thiamine-binding protein [Nitrospiraceae bacterium]